MQPILLSLLLSMVTFTPLSAHYIPPVTIVSDERIGIDTKSCEYFFDNPGNATFPMHIRGFAITIDKNRNVYFCNKADRTINKLNRDGNLEHVPTDSNGTFTLPTGLTIDTYGRKYFNPNNVTYRYLIMANSYSHHGMFSPNTNDSAFYNQSMLKYPFDFVVDPNRRLYLTDIRKNVIHVFDQEGNLKSVEFTIPKSKKTIDNATNPTNTTSAVPYAIHMFGGPNHVALDTNGTWFWINRRKGSVWMVPDADETAFDQYVHQVKSITAQEDNSIYNDIELDYPTTHKSSASNIMNSLPMIVSILAMSIIITAF